MNSKSMKFAYYGPNQGLMLLLFKFHDATKFVDAMLMARNYSGAYRISCILYFLAMAVNK